MLDQGVEVSGGSGANGKSVEQWHRTVILDDGVARKCVTTFSDVAHFASRIMAASMRGKYPKGSYATLESHCATHGFCVLRFRRVTGQNKEIWRRRRTEGHPHRCHAHRRFSLASRQL